MKPPICKYCSRLFSPQKGGLVKFSNYKPLPEGMVGHPHGLEWFCPEHLSEAQTLASLSTTKALVKLQKQFRKASD